MDLASALTTEGVLEKQSPGILRLYQSRYFAIRGKGDYLVWFKKKPVNPDQNPKGIIKIDTIQEVSEEDQDPRTFKLTYCERTFYLRAQSFAVRERWINALRTIITHHRKLAKNKLVKPGEKVAESWKWESNANKQISQQIRLQNEEVILQDAGNDKGHKNETILAQITKEKSLFEIENCIIYGFFTKKKLLNSNVRWYFLASGVNLKDEKDQQFYPATEQLIQSLVAPDTPKEQQEKSRKRKDSSSSEDQQQKLAKKTSQKPDKCLKINTLMQYDPETRQIRNSYSLVDVVSFETRTSEQPFEIRIVYEQVINEEDEQIKQNELVLSSEFLIEIKKLHQALKIISDKYSMQKQREAKNANKSKRYPARKWKYASQDQWRIPEEKSTLYVLLNKRFIRINMLGINLEDIAEHKKETLAIEGAKEEEGKSSKKQEVLYISYKKNDEQFKIYIMFDKVETIGKFLRRLGRNLKKMEEQLQAANAAKITNRKEQEKKVNAETYLIDKKVRETQTSIKVNFYEMMDREVITEKKEPNGNEQTGLWGKFMNMLCAGPTATDLL